MVLAQMFSPEVARDLPIRGERLHHAGCLGLWSWMSAVPSRLVSWFILDWAFNYVGIVLPTSKPPNLYVFPLVFAFRRANWVYSSRVLATRLLRGQRSGFEDFLFG